MSTPAPIFCIGHGGRTLDDLAALLVEHEIDVLIDVRSQPYSRWQPDFRKRHLEAALPQRGIEYIWLGEQLGGRPEDSSCYRDGRVQHRLVRQREAYAAGIDRLIMYASQRRRIAIMCAEGRPEHCHRTHLIAPDLIARRIEVRHVDETGAVRTHSEIDARIESGQLRLPFDS